MKLNLGCGGVLLDGYENWDRKTGQEAYPLPLPSGSVEEVRASHLLEHFPHADVMSVLTEWVRVLAPGGLLKVAVPDFEYIVQHYIQQRDDPHPHFVGWVMGGQTDPDDFHHCIFDYDTLAGAFEALGLEEICRWEPDCNDCCALPVSLNVQGRKPREAGEAGDAGVPAAPATAQEEPQQEPKSVFLPLESVAVVETAPRLGFVAHSDTLVNTIARELGLTMYRTGGAYWCQGLTSAMERAMAAQPELQYIITLDYDSVFTKADVLELLRCMVTYPEIDALCAIQMRRALDMPLFCTGQVPLGDARTVLIDRDDLARDTMPVRTGHFGLTVLRVAALQEVRKPWFLGVPDPNGGWEEGRMDADIYFWHNWAECGKTLHVANRCPIGHLELTVSWPGARLQKVVQPMEDWEKNRKPPGIWR